jgi:FixJ family two-component response regulator
MLADGDDALTGEEARMLDLIAQDKHNKQIAAAVFLAEGTVKNYASRIMEKLQACVQPLRAGHAGREPPRLMPCGTALKRR